MLRPWVFVGFTGHRNLANPDLVTRKIADALTRLANYSGGPLAAVSSAAKGADTLFAEAARERNLPWVLLLPLPDEDFFNPVDFDAADLARIQPLVPRALRKFIEPSTDIDLPSEIRRKHAFADCSARTVDESDYLIAVWNGDPGKPGGTGGAIGYARAQKKPVIWIHAVTGEVVEERFPPRVATGTDVVWPIDPVTGGLPLVEATLKHFDADAVRHAPKARNLLTQVVIIHLAATGVALLGSTVLVGYYWWMSLAVCLLVVGKIVALLRADYLAEHQHHAKHGWLHARIIAELCRSAQATWFLPYSDRMQKPFNVPNFRPWQRTLHLWRLLAPPAASPCDEATSDDPWQTARTAYLKTRFDDEETGQIRYFAKHLGRAEAAQGRLKFWAKTCTRTAILLASLVALLMLPDLIAYEPHAATYPEKVLKWLSLVLPLVSSTLFTFLIASDHNRRVERYRAMLGFLTDARKRIAAAKTRSALERHVAETETTLLLEVLEWHSVTHFTASAH